MEAITINSLEQVPGAINLMFRRFDELFAQISSQSNQRTPAIQEDPLLSRQQAAERLCISLPTLNEMTKSGAVKGYRIPGTNRLRYKASELDSALTVIKTSKVA